MNERVRVLLVPGSLRALSTNTALMRTLVAVAPANIDTKLFDGLADLPPFNPDDDVVPLPAAVAALRGEIHRADALLFSAPEYAGGLPGSFKNLLDWTIGDDQPASIYEKPVAWINASTRGAVDAHASLRKVLGYANATVVEAACLHIPVRSADISADGVIADSTVRERSAAALQALAAGAVDLRTARG